MVKLSYNNMLIHTSQSITSRINAWQQYLQVKGKEGYGRRKKMKLRNYSSFVLDFACSTAGVKEPLVLTLRSLWQVNKDMPSIQATLNFSSLTKIHWNLTWSTSAEYLKDNSCEDYSLIACGLRMACLSMSVWSGPSWRRQCGQSEHAKDRQALLGKTDRTDCIHCHLQWATCSKISRRVGPSVFQKIASTGS